MTRYTPQPASPLYGETQPRWWYILDTQKYEAVHVKGNGRLLSYNTEKAAQKSCAKLNAKAANVAG